VSGGRVSGGPGAPPGRPARPAHLQPRLLAVVAVGGAVGTAGRFGLGRALPPSAGWPWGTLTANLAGAFLLGLLLEALLRRGEETPGRRLARLGLGTGVLGGFTTFSALALELERLLAVGDLAVAAGYAGLTVVGGLAACAAGVALAARRHRRLAVAEEVS
jgi:CrcB protein